MDDAFAGSPLPTVIPDDQRTHHVVGRMGVRPASHHRDRCAFARGRSTEDPECALVTMDALQLLGFGPRLPQAVREVHDRMVVAMATATPRKTT